jgi:hypothetical protein
LGWFSWYSVENEYFCVAFLLWGWPLLFPWSNFSGDIVDFEPLQSDFDLGLPISIMQIKVPALHSN